MKNSTSTGVQTALTGFTAVVEIAGEAKQPGFSTVTPGLHAATGTTLWVREEEGGVGASALLTHPAGGRLFQLEPWGSADPYGPRVRAFATQTGALLWQDVYDSEACELANGAALSADGSTWYLTGQARAFGSPLASADMLTAAYDVASGERLWVARWDGAFQDEALALAIDPAGERLALVGWSEQAGEQSDLAVVSYGTPALLADPPQVSIGGGSQALTLRAGSARAGHLHLVLGSASGDFPGTPLGTAILPLNVDEYLFLTASQPGVPIDGALGQISETGAASAGFALPAGAPSSLIGATLHHAYVAIDVSGAHAALSLVSNAVAVQIGP